MAYRHQAVHTRIWHDEKFKALSDDARLLFFYVMTCPHSNLIGLFVLPKPYMAADLGWLPKRLEKPFRELFQKGFIDYDEKTSVIWIRNHLRYNPLDNPNQVKAAIKLIDELPKTRLFQGLSGFLEQFGKPFLKPLVERLRERLQEGFGKPEPETEPETETEPENNIYIAPNDAGIVSEPPSDSPPPKSKGPPKIDFDWETGTFQGITEEELNRWAEAYPAVDIELELRQAAEWLLANPHKRKKNYRRFLVSWFSRTQQRGGSKGGRNDRSRVAPATDPVERELQNAEATYQQWLRERATAQKDSRAAPKLPGVQGDAGGSGRGKRKREGPEEVPGEIPGVDRGGPGVSGGPPGDQDPQHGVGGAGSGDGGGDLPGPRDGPD